MSQNFGFTSVFDRIPSPSCWGFKLLAPVKSLHPLPHPPDLANPGTNPEQYGLIVRAYTKHSEREGENYL